MWIQSTNPAHENGAFKDARLDAPVQFSGNCTAQVQRAVGEYLVDAYDDFAAMDREDDEPTDDTDTDTA